MSLSEGSGRIQVSGLPDPCLPSGTGSHSSREHESPHCIDRVALVVAEVSREVVEQMGLGWPCRGTEVGSGCRCDHVIIILAAAIFGPY